MNVTAAVKRFPRQKEALLAFSGGFLLSCAPLGQFNPFGTALLCAADAGRPLVLLGALCALPFCRTGKLLQLLLLLGCFFLLAVAERQRFAPTPADHLRALLSPASPSHPAKKGLRILLCTLSALFTALGEQLRNGFSPASAVVSLALSCVCPLFCHLFSVLLKKGFREELPLLGGAFAVTQILLPLSLAGISPALCVGGLLTLAVTRNKGFPFGCAAGLLCGLTCGGEAMGALGVLGMTYGLLMQGAERLALLLAFMLSVSGYWYLGVGDSVFTAGLMLAISCAGFLLLSGRIPKRLPAPVSPVTALNDPALRKRHLQKYAAAFSSLSGVFYTVSENAAPRTADERLEGIRTVIRAFCRNCEGCDLEEGELCNCFADQLGSQGVIHVPSLPTHVFKRCPNIRPMAKTVNNLPTLQEREREEGIRRMATEYAGLSSLLDSAAKREEAASTKDKAAAAEIKSALREMKIRFDHVQVTGERIRIVEVFGVDLPKIPVSAAGLSQALSARLGCRLSQPEFCLHDDYAVMKLVSIPRFRIEYAKCTASKEGEKVCGDTVSFFETEEGCFYCLLSDGMGSGRDAALSSRLAAIMMEKLLTVGASPEDALRMLNKALQEKEKEVFATVDLLQIDRYFATATLIKAGAAPTLLFRDGNCRRFESKTPPAGIMKDVIAEKRSFKLKKGDVLLLLSDGVLQVEEGGGDLPVIHGGNAHAVANAVLSAARERTDRSDDMSVCALRIY